MTTVTLSDIKEARERIAPYIRRTPFIPFDYLSAQVGKDVWMKCESLQRTGSFKIRGASNCILKNLTQAKKSGVVTASAGNHAQGVATICKALGIKATIVMPTWTPPIKVENTKRSGAQVELVGHIYDESYEYAMKLATAKGFLFVHPYRDPDIIAGQGTIALELHEDPAFAEIEAVLIPVGGGGLASGSAIALKQLRPDLKIYGVAARNAPATWKSFHKGAIVEDLVQFTLAEGVAIKKTDPHMLSLLKEHLDDFFAISEESIAHSIALVAEHAKIITEGAGVLPVAALLEGLVPEKKVALYLCGGNLDIPALTHVLQRGLVEQGRVVRLVITVTDRPGGLNGITRVLAETGANILEVFHQRSNSHTKFGEAEVEVDVETRGESHTSEITQKLIEQGFRVHRDT
jgi:threonine dehydratase